MSVELPRRFVVRPTVPGYGVWDTSVNAWRLTGQSSAQAEQHAADLELQFDAWGPRPIQAVRRVTPAVPVDQAIWRPAGMLDHWVRVRTEASLVPRFDWYARIRTDTNHYLWLPSRWVRRSDHE